MQACPALARSSVRHSSSKLDSALAAPLIAFSDIVATRQSSSKLDSALAAPLIPASEPESHSCYSPREIRIKSGMSGQARNEGKNVMRKKAYHEETIGGDRHIKEPVPERSSKQ